MQRQDSSPTARALKPIGLFQKWLSIRQKRALPLNPEVEQVALSLLFYSRERERSTGRLERLLQWHPPALFVALLGWTLGWLGVSTDGPSIQRTLGYR